MERHRVLLIGATGVFGQRLARHLALTEELELFLSSRDADKAAHLARGLVTAAGTTATGIGLDHHNDLAERLAAIAPWLVIDASGPFQSAGYGVPRAALEAGAHVVDLADARDYILGYGAALNELARSKGLVALAGASSTPALSVAATMELIRGWARVDTIEIAIAPGGRSPVGEAVIAAILSYVGRPSQFGGKASSRTRQAGSTAASRPCRAYGGSVSPRSRRSMPNGSALALASPRMSRSAPG